MSWLARSIANSLTVTDGKESPEDVEVSDKQSNSSASTPSSPPEAQQGRGVKEDLSEIKNSLARQLRGVASFLAPPPVTNSKIDDESETEEADSGKVNGIRSDFAEIRVKMKAGISKLLQSRSDDSDEGRTEETSEKSVIGVTEELLAFVKDLVTHPRTWVRFPLPEDADADDFALNGWQQAHAGAVERQVPELADLRWELCPEHMSEGRFWMIYFVLVHPKLDKYDAVALSTPKINEARAMLTQESKHRRKVKQPEGSLVLSNVQDGYLPSAEPSVKDVRIGASLADSALAEASVENETQKRLFPSDESPAQNEDPAIADHKNVTAVPDFSSESKVSVHGEDEDDDGDDWLNDETPDGDTIRHIPINNDDEDVSFSDLEEDDATGTAKGNK